MTEPMECRICCNHSSDALLECGHTLCVPCALTITDVNDGMACPFCRQVVSSAVIDKRYSKVLNLGDNCKLKDLASASARLVLKNITRPHPDLVQVALRGADGPEKNRLDRKLLSALRRVSLARQ